MFYLDKLKINNFRCFAEKEITFSKHLNILKGENGSGKTSILEAINLNLYSKSFRTNNLNSTIQEKKDFTRLELSVENSNLKMKEKIVFFREKQSKVKGINNINFRGKKTSVGEVVKILPIQFINQDDFFVLNGTPKERRKFLDWGVFHVKQNFYQSWKDYSIILKQRNYLLKQKNKDENLFDILDAQLINLTKALDESRQEYLNIYKEEIESQIKNWKFLKDLDIKYYPGWDNKKEFKDILQQNRKRDLETGLTNYGPHRCDLKFEIKNQNVLETFSRGQQKILVIILKILQGIFLEKITQKKCVYLIDDLFSELDIKNYKKIMDEILSLNNQIILTTKDKFDFQNQNINEISL